MHVRNNDNNTMCSATLPAFNSNWCVLGSNIEVEVIIILLWHIIMIMEMEGGGWRVDDDNE